MNNFNGVYTVRDYKEEDKALIMSTFLRGTYYGDTWFQQIPKDAFMAAYQRFAEALIARSVVKVACSIEDADVILGYSILSPDFQAIHYVYVKSGWRKGGIGRSLVPKYPACVTHLTKLGKVLLSKFDKVIFNPFYGV